MLYGEDGSKIPIDIVFPVLHGPMGEDGTLQGLLEVLNVPYVGPEVLSSSVCMDKDFLKTTLQSKNIPVTPFVTLHRYHNSLSYENRHFCLYGQVSVARPKSS